MRIMLARWGLAVFSLFLLGLLVSHFSTTVQPHDMVEQAQAGSKCFSAASENGIPYLAICQIPPGCLYITSQGVVAVTGTNMKCW